MLLIRDPAERETVMGAIGHTWIKTDLTSLTKAYEKLVEQDHEQKEPQQ